MRNLSAAVVALVFGAMAIGPTALAEQAGPPSSSGEVTTIADAYKTLGPMPPDSDPAAQAAWRVRHYEIEIESDHHIAERDGRSAERERQALERRKVDDPNDPRRMRVLRSLDYFSSLQNLSELHAQAAGAAKAAVAEAEAVRLAVGEGTRPAQDLSVAHQKSAQAQRLAETAQRARMDKTLAFTQADAKASGAPGASIGLRLGDMLAAQERARLESVAYSDVREAVEAGRRPPIDLEAARQSLKAAQIVVWDQIDAMTKANLAMMAKLREDAVRHAAEAEARVAADETELATLSAEARPHAEERLRLHRELLESYRQSAALSVSLPVMPRRPELPILPPRS